MNNKLTLKAEQAEGPPPMAAPDAPRMETASCICRLMGDVRNEVPLQNISAPEIILLRAIHGGTDSIYKVERTGESRLSAAGERMRLLSKYSRYSKLIVELFPGLAPQFPRTILEVEDMARFEQERAEREMSGELEANPLEQ